MSSQYEKFLGATIDYKLSCNIHVDNLCKNANRKLHALARVTPCPRQKKTILANEFFKSQFNCFPLVWMFNSRAHK